MDLSRAKWRKSSHSGYTNCVEVARLDRQYAVRSSRQQQGPALILTPSKWRTFLKDARDGVFDPP